MVTHVSEHDFNFEEFSFSSWRKDMSSISKIIVLPPTSGQNLQELDKDSHMSLPVETWHPRVPSQCVRLSTDLQWPWSQVPTWREFLSLWITVWIPQQLMTLARMREVMRGWHPIFCQMRLHSATVNRCTSSQTLNAKSLNDEVPEWCKLSRTWRPSPVCGFGLSQPDFAHRYGIFWLVCVRENRPHFGEVRVDFRFQDTARNPAD